MNRYPLYFMFIILLSCERDIYKESLSFEAVRSYLSVFKSDSLNSIMNPIPKMMFELKVLNNSKIVQEIKIAETIDEPGNFFISYCLDKENDTLFNTRYQNFASFDISPGDTLNFDLVLSLSKLEIEDAKEMFKIANEGNLFYIGSDKVYEIHKAENFEVIYRDSSSLAVE